MKHRELLLRRAVPGILAIAVLFAVVLPLLVGLASAGMAIGRILRHS